MKLEAKTAPLWIAGIYLLCEAGKDLEFLVLKTDQTVVGENIFCKLLALAVIGVSLRKLHLSWRELGFRAKGFLWGAALGLALGAATFAVSYGAEFLVLRGMGLHPRLAFYIANFALTGPNITGVTLPALVICLAGNALNVWAEEGLFRGLLFRLGQTSLSLRRANLLQALLFGLWHVVIAVGWMLDGSLGPGAALGVALGYVALAGVLGYEWGLCAVLTGTLWTGVCEHFFNNFITNSLHMVTETGADEWQVLRIVLSNVLSLLLVLAAKKWYGGRAAKERRKNQKASPA